MRRIPERRPDMGNSGSPPPWFRLPGREWLTLIREQARIAATPHRGASLSFGVSMGRGFSGWAATVSAGLLLIALPAGAAPKGPATTPEGNPIGQGVAAPSVAPTLRKPAPPPPPPPPTPVEGVVIQARPAAPPIDTVTAFVADVSAPTINGRLARWDRKICPGVIGLQPAYAQKIIDRIATIAVTIGLQVGDPGCKANMVIVATDDSQAMAKMVVDRNKRTLEGGVDGSSRGRKALAAFVETPREVRWWHVTQTIGVDGFGYQRDMTGGPGSLAVRSLGRIRATTKDNFLGVIIMVDVTRIGVIRFDALTDYIAMVGLAQIDPDTDPSGVPTVLNLFAARDKGATPPLGLTSWDVAYLQSLYTTDPAAVRGSRQSRQIVKGMADRLGVAPSDRTDEDEGQD